MIRPRIGAHIQVRRHLIGDGVRIVLHDGSSGRHMAVGEREWRALQAMDGTRDPAGIALASGIDLSQIEVFLELTERLGITGATAAEDTEEHTAKRGVDLPVRALPGRGFSCTGVGSCCALADSILFTPLEAARARVAAPSVLDAGHFGERAFLPASGLDDALLAVAAKDGACVYLGPSSDCSIYDVRPRGCRTHPRRYVDVGHEIRVAPRLVCACEFEPSSMPLTMAERGAELAPELWVESLPERVHWGTTILSRVEAVARMDALEAPIGDVADWYALQADQANGPPLDLGKVAERIETLMREHEWRAPNDLLRRSLGFVAVALSRDAETIDPQAEMLAWEATRFAGGLLERGDVGRACRQLETHLRIARRFDEVARKEPFAQHPLAVVNAVARATGGW